MICSYITIMVDPVHIQQLHEWKSPKHIKFSASHVQIDTYHTNPSPPLSHINPAQHLYIQQFVLGVYTSVCQLPWKFYQVGPWVQNVAAVPWLKNQFPLFAVAHSHASQWVCAMSDRWHQPLTNLAALVHTIKLSLVGVNDCRRNKIKNELSYGQFLKNCITSSILFFTSCARYRTFNLGWNATFSHPQFLLKSHHSDFALPQIFFKTFFLSLLVSSIFTHFIPFSPTKHSIIH